MSSRSDFLKQAAGATIAVAGAGAGAAALAGAARASTVPPNTYSLEVGGANWGYLFDASGGDPEYDVVVTGHDANGDPEWSLGKQTWSPFTVQVGAGMAPEMYAWINSSFNNKPPAIDGAIVTNDQSGFEIGRRSFTNARMTGFSTPPLLNRPMSFPAMTLTFEAASVSDDTPTAAAVSAPKQKAWLCSNFRLEVKGLSSRVTNTLSYSWSLVPPPAGSTGRVIDPGNLSVGLAPAAVPSWQQWYDTFALGGNASDERDGTLKVWGSTHSVPLFEWSFQGLGIVELAHRGILDPGTDVGMVAEMYVQRAQCACSHL